MQDQQRSQNASGSKSQKASPALVEPTVNGLSGSRPSRRQAIQWVLSAVAASSLAPPVASPEGSPAAFGRKLGQTAVPQEEAAGVARSGVRGYGLDADLTKIYAPGDVWPLTLTEPQRDCTTALADFLLPKDQFGPAASELNVPAMIDEWVSAPYPQQQADHRIVIEGLAWLEGESNKRFKASFAKLTDEQRTAICKDIADQKEAKKEFKDGAKFFAKFRGIACGAYYASPPGWEAIGYVGNVALGSFDGPPPEVLAKLGVEQTVK